MKLTMTNIYSILPFRFTRKNDSFLLVNDVGEFMLMNESDFRDLTNFRLSRESEQYLDLKARHFICEGNLADTIDLLATRFRSKKRYLYDFTSLYMLVVTRRCNQQCIYCHASSVDSGSDYSYDMQQETAHKCVESIFKGPAKRIKIEFQGGEPLLNFNIVQEICRYSKKLNLEAQKTIDFVICTNLLGIDDDQLDFLISQNVAISTSCDGPERLHDACRVRRNGLGTYSELMSSISKIQSKGAQDRLSALMTVTSHNIDKLREVIDEYIRLGFKEVFIRHLNPFGRARIKYNLMGYTVAKWIDAYKRALHYLIEKNLEGIQIAETYATILLTRMLTPFSTGFVDLQSPTGAGISSVIYDTNGDVYVSDEGRMLAAATGDKYFCLGNVHQDSWQGVFCGFKLKEIVSETCLETIPGCSWCAYLPFCGSDPVRNYIEHNSCSRQSKEFCERQKGIFQILFDLILNGGPAVQDVLWAWITSRSLKEIRMA